MLRREKWYLPHSTHAYQKLARRNGHLPIAIGVATINVAVLAPVAWMAWLHPALGFPLAIAANGVLGATALTVCDKRLSGAPDAPEH
jgi:hypothetical protein